MRRDISCPATGERLTSEIGITAYAPRLVLCPACNGKHLWMPIEGKLVSVTGMDAASNVLASGTAHGDEAAA